MIQIMNNQEYEITTRKKKKSDKKKDFYKSKGKNQGKEIFNKKGKVWEKNNHNSKDKRIFNGVKIKIFESIWIKSINRKLNKLTKYNHYLEINESWSLNLKFLLTMIIIFLFFLIIVIF